MVRLLPPTPYLNDHLPMPESVYARGMTNLRELATWSNVAALAAREIWKRAGVRGLAPPGYSTSPLRGRKRCEPGVSKLCCTEKYNGAAQRNNQAVLSIAWQEESPLKTSQEIRMNRPRSGQGL